MNLSLFTNSSLAFYWDLEPQSPMAFLAASPPARNAKCVLTLGHNQTSNPIGVLHSQPSNCICCYVIDIVVCFRLWLR